MKNIFKYIVENINTGNIDKQTAVQMIKMLKEEEVKTSGDIAVIGMAANFPLADTLEDYWELIANGMEAIRRFPETRRKDIDDYLKSQSLWTEGAKYADAAYLEHIDLFDNGFFRISPKEASLMDPSQRLFLETVWRAIEDAGYGGEKITGTNTGVYVGYANNLKDSYGKLVYDTTDLDASSIVGNLTAIIPGRIAYYLDLKGPSMVVDTACSSSLVSIALACQAIRNRQCEMAIAGGIRLSTVPLDNENEQLGIESTDGKTRAFDHLSDGAGVGEGVGAVLLKPLHDALRDGDNIYAVIKGVGVNQDGLSMSMTAPNPVAQTEVIVKAWEDANIDPETISYIETHGTGTNLGDPIEVKGIQNAFRQYTNKTQFCAVSSVKTNIGHLFEAAGIANFIKAVLALKHKKLPPLLHFNNPNRTIDFLHSPVYINTKMRDWETGGHPRRCGVSSFGISGTNAHLVLEEAPAVAETEAGIEAGCPYLLTLSAKSRTALQALAEQYKQYVDKQGEALRLHDVCYTANTGRGHYTHRLALIAFSADELRMQLELWEELSAGEDGVYYAQHKLVGQNREAAEPDELTQADLQALDVRAKEALQDWSPERLREPESLEALSRLYIAGAQIEWERVYQGEQARRLRLPVYPFERSRFWLDVGTFEEVTPHADADLYYTMKWVPSELAPQADAQAPQGSVLIFKDAAGLGDRLAEKFREQGRRAIVVELQDAYQKVTEDHYLIDGQEANYDRLLRAVQGAGITQVLHLFSRTGAQELANLIELQHSQQLGLYSMFHLTRALVRNSLSDTLDVCLISDYVHEVTGAEKVLKPQNASLFGIGKVVSLEYPNLRCRCIDLDEQADLDTLLTELNTTSTHYQVAYRDGGRYVEQFSEIDLDSVPDQPFAIKSDGVYVMTGGAGGISLEIAKYFASQNTPQLAFLNRTPMPEYEQWDAILDDGSNRKLCHKIRSIREIESLGAKVANYAVDVASHEDMSRVLGELRATYGRINGVLHAAGIPGDGFLIRKEQDVFDEVISPKIWGTWVLDQLTADDDLDFFIIFSSGISILGEAGQGDYVAANAFLDAYTAYRNKKGKQTVVFDWVSWKSAGMSVEYGFNVDLIFKSIPTEQAIHGFDACLHKQIPRVLVGELNAQSEYMAILETLSFNVSPKIQTLLEQSKTLRMAQKHTRHETKRAPGGKGEVRLTGKDGASYTDVEKTVAQIYRDTLGFEEINIHDSFFELGGDSVMLNQMHAKMEKEFPGKVKVSDLFAHTSIAKIAQHIGHAGAGEKLKPRVEQRDTSDDDIAVIGISVDMPMAGDNTDQFWMNILNGVDCIQTFPEQRAQDMTDYLMYAEGETEESIKYLDGAYLDDIDQFDYKFFRLSPAEAKLTDPHQRLFMKTVWHAIEDAGYGGGRLSGSNTGVYVGFAGSLKDSYQRLINEIDPELLPVSAVGNITAMIPSRISYLLDLKGPAMVIDTACSSTLVAIHTACRDLKGGDADMAIIAGVRISLMPIDREYMKIGIESSTGRTMTFDHGADGSGLGEGAAAVILKPLRKALEDRDQVYAVIKGSAINQDGTSMGITAPNPAAQEAVILKAWQRANIDPETLSFIEAHGTATPLGDPIEIDALQNAFKHYTDNAQFCAIGAVKTNLGHLYEAAGVTSFVKSVLALKNRVIPPSVHFNRPNGKIDFANSPIYINTKPRQWDTQNGPMRCGVSSFGFSGTNCHIVLEEAPPPATEERATSGLQVFTLSAKSEYSFDALAERYREFVGGRSDLNLEDLCFTANIGREHFPHRLAVVLQPGEKLADKLLHESAGVHRGFHRIVTEHKGAQDDLALTERERSELTAQAQAYLDQFLASGKQDAALLSELCALYVRGAEVAWEELYADVSPQKIGLPVYPFEPNRCWIDVPEGRKFMPVSEAATAPDQFFTIAWRAEGFAADAELLEATGPVLILKDEQGLGTELAARYRATGRQVVEVEVGDAYAKLSDDRYVFTGAEADYAQLIADLHEVPFDKILHLLAIRQQAGVTSFSELEASQHLGVYSAFHLIRALAHAEIERRIDLFLIAENVSEVTGTEACLQPENATLLGLGKVVPKEIPHLIVRGIDLDGKTSVDAFWPELETASDLYQAAYRDGVRYVEEFTEIDASGAEERPLTIKEHGVYLITGGTGGIGLEVARYFASQNPVHLVLINRSQMPERERWQELLERGEDERNGKKIRDILDIESTGSTVSCYSVDVTNRDELSAVLADVRAKFGRIDGIVHGAGVGGAEALAKREIADFHAVFNPKVLGTWNLDELTREDNLDFMMLFSSIATMFTMPGQSDYIAANGYLDAYTSYRNRFGLRTVTINWSTWRETGMSVSHNFNIDTLFKAIMTREAIAGLHTVLNRNIPRALIGEVNYESKIVFLLEKSMFRLSEKINRELAKRTGGSKSRKRKKGGFATNKVILVGNESGEYAETEKRIAQICQETLGFEEINIYDNFFEMGADSILLTRMHGLIDQAYPGAVAVTDIFEYTSIYKLAQYINAQQAGPAPAAHEQKEDLEDTLRNIFDDLENDNISLEDALNSLKDM